MNLQEFLKATESIDHYGYQRVRPRIRCVDGFTVSVQAGRALYSTIRPDGSGFSAVELGFPSAADDLIMEYAEDERHPTETVYGWVPVEIIEKLIEKHGGIASQPGEGNEQD